MGYIFFVNKHISSRTARFWRKHHTLIETDYPDATIIFPKTMDEEQHIDFSLHEIIVFVGDDMFFNQMINKIYDDLMKNCGRNIMAFIPDSSHSALADGLALPHNIERSINLLKSKQTIPLDVIRCHFIDAHGFPNSALVLNDAVIGLPRLNPSDILQRLAKGIGNMSFKIPQKTLKQVTLLSEGKPIYEGCYSVAAILLGRKLTRGLKLRSRRVRINLAKFDFVQLNTKFIKNFPSYIPELLTGKPEEKEKEKGVFSRKLAELEMKAIGEENRIIADGVYLGRLPATFTLLPKALRVISPLVIKPIKKPWRENLAVTVPKPIINREIQVRKEANRLK